jgi:hypothetical protein
VGVKTASLPPQPLPKTMASPGLLAHIAVAKYQDALPLHRQEHILKRIGIELPRATLAAWMIKLGIWIQPLINLLQDVLFGYDILHMDETTLQVLKELGKAPRSHSYLWVRRGGPPHQPVILFDYDPSRSQAVPLRLLGGYRGYLQVDGYDGYNAVGLRSDIVLVGCMAMRTASSTRRSRPRGHIRTTPGRPARPWQGFTPSKRSIGSSTKARTSPRRAPQLAVLGYRARRKIERQPLQPHRDRQGQRARALRLSPPPLHRVAQGPDPRTDRGAVAVPRQDPTASAHRPNNRMGLIDRLQQYSTSCRKRAFKIPIPMQAR